MDVGALFDLSALADSRELAADKGRVKKTGRRLQHKGGRQCFFIADDLGAEAELLDLFDRGQHLQLASEIFGIVTDGKAYLFYILHIYRIVYFI